LFEALAKLTRSRSHFRSAVRCVVLFYLTVWLGAGTTLGIVHIESSEHGHRYCPEHDQIEAVEHGNEGDAEALAAGREVSDSSSLAVETAARLAPHSHVACALMNGLSSRTTATPDTHGVVIASTDDSKPAVALSERITAFDSVLFVAPKTSPPPVAD
jgi:hypothetical protein